MTQQQTDQWNMTKTDVLRMVDKLGRPLDDEIVDTVVALQMLGIHTTASCSGHIDRVTGGPYVVFSAPEANPLEEAYLKIARPADPEYKSLRNRAVHLNLKERQRLFPPLEEFYVNRPVKYMNRLIITRVGPEGSKLKCQGAEMSHLLDDQGRQSLLAEHQAEMRAFTDYLRQRIG